MKIILGIITIFIVKTLSFKVETYWDSSYVIPPNRHCRNRGALFERPIDIWKHVPQEFRKANLTIIIAFADFDLDRYVPFSISYYL